MTLRAAFDYIIEEASQLGFYTHVVLGYIIASLDSFAQVVLIILYLFYMTYRAKEDPGTRRDVARFFTGYLAHEVKAAVLPA